MSDLLEPPETIQASRIQRPRGFSLVWLIPIVAVCIAAWLGLRTLAQEGRTITITFQTADGLTAGQTKVKHKAVDLGTVRSINLARDMSHVVVRVEMRREADRVLTDHARFWVVRPRLTTTSISGLETLVSGSYIELDPGTPGGTTQTDFTGLEQPAAVRSDEPGHSFTLDADRLGSLGVGSPVFFRDNTVGEVISTSAGSPGRHASLRIFVRAPYDKYVREGSYFWNDSGLSVTAGAEGIHVEVESVQALLSGAVAFDTPPEALKTPALPEGTTFTLLSSEKVAAASRYRQQLAFLVDFRGSVRGLAVGAPVDLYGIQVGTVTDVKLQYDPATQNIDVQVRLVVQPERIFAAGKPLSGPQTLAAVRELVRRGLRAQLHTANYLTGQLLVGLDFFPDAPPAEAVMQGDAIVLPGHPGGLESITTSLDQIMEKLDRLPLDQIAKNLNGVLASLNKSAPELTSTLQSAAATMRSARELVDKLNTGSTPLLHRLPQIAASLQSTVDRANRLIGSLNGQYGGNSEFPHQLDRLMAELNDTARSIRTLADFLDQHPEALVRGRTGSINER